MNAPSTPKPARCYRPRTIFWRFLFLFLFAAFGCNTPTATGTPPDTPPPSTSLPTPNTAESDLPLSENTPENTPALPTQPALPNTPTPALVSSAYDIGSPTLSEFYISPTGNDTHDGLTPETALQTLTAAWDKIPSGTLTTGYRINLLPGTYPCEPAEPDDCRNYFSNRQGTYEFPIIIRALHGPGTATLRGGMDISQVSYLYLMDYTLAGGIPLPLNASGNNLLHFASVDHILVRGMTLDGPDCITDACNNLQEALKINQAQYVYIENSDISGVWHSTVDYVSVQYGHFLQNHVHTAGEWCMYLKGGTAYHLIEGNEFDNCHLGFQAGQSTNMAVMRAPWVHYEAYDIKFINNILHDIEGVSLSVMGGYNILFAYNTLYHVGYDDDPGYALLQTVHGERGCNPTDEIPDPVAVCNDLIAQGGWGPDHETENLPVIPNRNIYIYNNLIYNPAPAQTLWAHLNIFGYVPIPNGFQNLPDYPSTDDNLVIAGNLIWNGPIDHPLGLDEFTGCQDTNPTCNPAQILADNTINTIEPELVNPAGGDYHPLAGGNVFSIPTLPIPDFTWDDFAPTVPNGNSSNVVSQDYEGVTRPTDGPPGAFVHSAPPLRVLYIPLVVQAAQ
ncbi:MAG: right-handed parallel beta-helix repeat-containing protein [Anaerolineales bacterium]|nr:right-handed parallel beta-helix repeat-containing protein [Anaerolineales bacterium]